MGKRYIVLLQLPLLLCILHVQSLNALRRKKTKEEKIPRRAIEVKGERMQEETGGILFDLMRT